MNTYSITTRENGLFMGNFQGATWRDAVDAYCRDAGHSDMYDACESLETTPDRYLSELIVEEV
jgi:hypothetical protein